MLVKIVAFVLLSLSFPAQALLYQAGITSEFPSGARSLGMGEVGVALANDENVSFYNPAGLGFFNQRWQGGAVCRFSEILLPVLRIPGLWHKKFAAVYQPAGLRAGGFAIDLNILNFGRTEDISGIRINDNYEYVISAGWGYQFLKTERANHSAGINMKFIESNLFEYFPQMEAMSDSLEYYYVKEGDYYVSYSDRGMYFYERDKGGYYRTHYEPANFQGKTFAFDLGYLVNWNRSMRFGVTLVNIGAPIKYSLELLEDSLVVV
ncbi:hypothetical protein CHISP_0031 [Chitinispirillum alkaliphilum]|nr:hypothetical protein CHISP_0031 [Chitinispirillum alkaliphilum]